MEIFFLVLLVIAVIIRLLGDMANRELLATYLALFGIGGLIAQQFLYVTWHFVAPVLQRLAARPEPYQPLLRRAPISRETNVRASSHQRLPKTAISYRTASQCTPTTTLSIAAAANHPLDIRNRTGLSDVQPLLRSGDTLHNRYLILNLVARTGYRIYRALDVWTSRYVAIKQCVAGGAAGTVPHDVLEACLINEAAILRHLPEGMAPTIVELVREGSALTLVMEWVEGKTVNSILDDGELSCAEAAMFVRGICGAVMRLHALTPALLHKDLKPSNMIRTPDGRIVIIDYGIAEWPGVGMAVSPALGTLPYSSPEQRCGALLDVRTDVYALGVILREVLDPLDDLPPIRRALLRATTDVRYQRTSSVAPLHTELDRGLQLLALERGARSN